MRFLCLCFLLASCNEARFRAIVQNPAPAREDRPTMTRETNDNEQEVSWDETARATEREGTHCLPTGAPSLPNELSFVPMLVDTPIERPVQMTVDTYDRTYVISKDGVIFRAPSGITPEGSLTQWFDWSAAVDSRPNEAGLLSIAFDPRFSLNGYVYLHYNRRSGSTLESVISRFTVDTLPDGSPDPASELVLLTVDQPYGNHNGGQIAFGPDGYLYIALGDGGSAGDPLGHGQNLETLLGSILRIDVSAARTDERYRVPPSNPFVTTPGARGEIYAYGLRNAWRFSFDSVTDNLWAGDVGQNAWEEINIVERGGNYGWKTMEGDRCYSPASGCIRDGLALPVVSLPRNQARSITGGFVYRGTRHADLYGVYVYGDYVTRRVWGLVPDGLGGHTNKFLGMAPGAIASFGLDNAGELYLLSYSDGRIYRVDVSAEVTEPLRDGWPSRLSQTGCFADLNERTFADDIHAYNVNVPYWSNGATKERALRLPPGEQLTPADDGRLAVPVGTVAIKTFVADDEPIETRLLVRTADGVSGVAYRWNEDASDALLTINGTTVDSPLGAWEIPGAGDCQECHQYAGDFLGMRTDQLHVTDVDGTSQLTAWIQAGLVHGGSAIDVDAIEPLTTTAGTTASRARTYLDVNCASCHHPGGTDLASFDLQLGTPLVDTYLCDVVPDQGDMDIRDARLLAPGDPERSLILARMTTDDEVFRMPRIGRTHGDDLGMGLVRRWIEQLPGCLPER